MAKIPSNGPTTIEDDPVSKQRDYYAETASRYDNMHEFDEHRLALWQIAAFIRQLRAQSVLDTGCGTGLGMRYLADAVPGLRVHGNDPSAALLAIAQRDHGLAAAQLDCADSTSLPYADGDFDIVIETAMLHHVPKPEAVVAEMLRVAKLAVFISDSNFYALGGTMASLIKLALKRLGVLRLVNRRRRGGVDWYFTDGDGVAWSYSVYDSLSQLRGACSEVIVIPTEIGSTSSASIPLMASPHVLAAGFKRPLLNAGNGDSG